MNFFLPIFLTLLTIDQTQSHGRLMDPPSRSSAWRIGWPTPRNYDDNALYCGGFAIGALKNLNDKVWSHISAMRYEIAIMIILENNRDYKRMMNNGGRCGICGDPYDGVRKNEAGGIYATGTIFKNYTQGEVITAEAEITANHCGHMEFRICPNNNVKKAATQECLDRNVLQLADGSGTKYKVPCGKTGSIYVKLKLPDNLVCSQCVVQWKYHAGNSWGVDPVTLRGCVGCGAQEEFYGCSDVRIVQSDSVPQPPVAPTTQPPRPIVTQTVPTRRRPTLKVTKPSVPTQQPAKAGGNSCKAINLWAGDPTLDKWCTENCAIGNCPSLACDCSNTSIVTDAPTTPKRTTTTTKPTTTTPTPTATTRKPTTTTTTQTTTTRIMEKTTTAGPYYITRTECRGINLWAGYEYLDRWCADACARGVCPSDSCACNKTQVLVTKATEETLIPFVPTNVPVTNAPITGAVVNTVKVCKAISDWTGFDVFDQWCTKECNKGYCPASTCVCTETQVKVLTTAPAMPQATTTMPAPKTTSTTTTTVKSATTKTLVPVRQAKCISNGIVGGQYWDDWCQENCDRGYCAADYCNCL